MTAERISPLWARVIEDMRIPGDGRKGAEVPHPGYQRFRQVPGAFAGYRHPGGVARLPVAHDRHRGHGQHVQRTDRGASVLLRDEPSLCRLCSKGFGL